MFIFERPARTCIGHESACVLRFLLGIEAAPDQHAHGFGLRLDSVGEPEIRDFPNPLTGKGDEFPRSGLGVHGHAGDIPNNGVDTQEATVISLVTMIERNDA